MDNVQSRNHYLQVRNTSLLYYSVSDTVRSNRSNASTYFGNNDSRESDTLSTYSGNMTRGSVKNIRRAVDIMLQITPTQRIYNPILSKEVDFRLSFITLTVSDNTRFISGKECYEKCLKPFLDWLRRSQKCNTYIWKAERQKATTFDGAIKNSKGQIHYHITCNAFINYDTLERNGIAYKKRQVTWYRLPRNTNTTILTLQIYTVYTKLKISKRTSLSTFPKHLRRWIMKVQKNLKLDAR